MTKKPYQVLYLHAENCQGMNLRNVLFTLPFFLSTTTLFSQSNFFEKIELLTDTAIYNSRINYITVHNNKKIYFEFNSTNNQLEVRLFPKVENLGIKLVPSRDYDITDSILNLGDYSRFKVQFKNIFQSDLLRFTLAISDDTHTVYEEIYIQPLINTNVFIYPSDDQLFIGEEKIFEVITNYPQNLKISNEWIITENIDYKYSTQNDKIFLHIVPKILGEQNLLAQISAIKPLLTKAGKLNYQLEPIVYKFIVKASRLQFLSIDKVELTYSEETKLNGLEIQLENSRLLEMQKTYRVEPQEEAGGALIAEIFTKQRMANNKVLCIIRPYNLHRNTDGYLYIKDGDNPKFITNVSITPATLIEKISILHEGAEWHLGNTINPGETVDIKIEGEGLHKAKFHFEELTDLTKDTLIKSEYERVFKLMVPLNISKKRLNIYNYNTPTGEFLNVVEYQRPRELDFVYLNYGELGRRISGVKEPILYDKVIKDLTITFNTDKIDDEKLYGKQYIDIKVQITGKKNELVELKTIENIAVCPSGESSRSDYYSTKDCFTDDISLNKYIRRPTYTLDDWSNINIVVEHNELKYGGEGYKKEVDIILKRKYSFDVEVSFPAGLLTIYPKDTSESIGSLSGISMAMIAQFSFYNPNKINTYRPYKIGAGFLALNAFNLSEGMDLSLVVLGSIYPTTKDVKLTFPLYVGFGYALSKKETYKTPGDRFFFLVGPGIRVRF